MSRTAQAGELQKRLGGLAVALGFCVAGVLAGCGGDDFSTAAHPSLTLSDGTRVLAREARIELLPSAVSVDEPMTRLYLGNAGDAPLEITAVSISAGNPAEAFELSGALPTIEAPWTVDVGASARQIDIWLTDLAAVSPDASFSVRVETNADVHGQTVATIRYRFADATPQLQLPTIIDFGLVGAGQTGQREIALVNLGTAALVIDGVTLTGPSEFAITLPDGTRTPASADGAIHLAQPLVVGAGQVVRLPADFSPSGPSPAEAELVFRSNAASSPDAVTLVANASGPCITVNPSRVEFGGKKIGNLATADVTIGSCGDAALEIAAIELAPESSVTFTIDTAGLELPVSLAPGASLVVPASFVPDALSPLGEDGKPVAFVGTVRIETNAYEPERAVDLRGFGVEFEKPTAVLSVVEGEEVIPQTQLHLIGSDSFGAAPIGRWEWTVTQPPGSQSVFLPSGSAPDPVFEANVVGSYTFQLRVWDVDQVESWNVAEYTVLVLPDEAIHVELLWDTPADIDQTDEGNGAGSDMDLHFLHPFATGMDIDDDGVADGWFDVPFDAFWMETAPDWGEFDNAEDDPSLDRDDTDGAGPENLNLNLAQDGLPYRVGVHYWDDHGWGWSDATVRIYVRKLLVFEATFEDMAMCDLWEVATIAWPSGDVTAVTEADGTMKRDTFCHPLSDL